MIPRTTTASLPTALSGLHQRIPLRPGKGRRLSIGRRAGRLDAALLRLVGTIFLQGDKENMIDVDTKVEWEQPILR